MAIAGRVIKKKVDIAAKYSIGIDGEWFIKSDAVYEVNRVKTDSNIKIL